jgi:long-chain fatty acid transport protein
MLTKLARTLAVLAVAITPLRAHATGIMVARFGGEHGSPMTFDPTALYYNPAAIAFAHGTNLYVEGLFVLRSYGYTRPADAIDNPGTGTPDPAVNSGKASMLNYLASPFLGVTSDLGVDGLGVGAAVYVPFGGSAMWDKTSAFAGNTKYPGAVDGPQRWWDIEGTIRAIYFTVGGAYRLPGNLSVGLGANVVLHNTADLRAATALGTDDVVDGNQNVEGRAFLDTSGVTFALGAGLAWQPTPEWTIGASYQSQPGFGTFNEEGTLEKILPPGGVTHQDINQRYALPDVIRLGASYRPAKNVEVRLWGSFERWSVFTSQCILDKANSNQECVLDSRGKPTSASGTVVNNIPRDWQDAFALRASGSYWIKPSIELELGVGYDGNAVPDKTLELSLPDEQKINATVGARFRDFAVDRMSLILEYSAFFGLPRTVAVSAPPFDPPSRVPDSAGDYSEFIGVLTVGLGYTF